MEPLWPGDQSGVREAVLSGLDSAPWRKAILLYKAAGLSADASYP